jgi:GntR family transcriptional repressor for pyruvate dehydrogenase complex
MAPDLYPFWIGPDAMKPPSKKPIESKSARKKLFSSVTTPKIPDVVYDQLISLITNGHLKPGERLPSERTMAMDLGVSRQSIREAIFRAKSAGLIEVRQGGGTFVISSMRENMKPPLSLLLEGQAEKIFEFLEIRKLIEGWCAEKASREADDADMDRMDGILERMEKARPADSRWDQVDLDFHASIASASHNIIAIHLFEGLKDSFYSYFQVKKFSTRPERKDVLLRQHQAIFQAIRRRNPEEAKRKILEHLDYVEEIIHEDFIGDAGKR